MPPSTIEEFYAELCTRLREAAVLRSCGELLGWDEQTNMPNNGAAHRAEQGALLAGLAHERATAPRIGELIGELEQSELMSDGEMPIAANIREARRDFERETRLPRRLVEELSRTGTLAQQNWVEARKKSDFATFKPWLEKMITLKREVAAALSSPGSHPYDALLDQYEGGATTVQLQALFTPLRQGLVQLIERIRGAKNQISREILQRHYPQSVQKEFGLEVARAIGFDFDAGRLDVAVHPFCSGIGPGDVRMTTRYDERDLPTGLYGVMHEAGHGLYEQGLDPEAFGLPMGTPASLGVHESQSRLWENFIGRSLAFWEFFLPRAQFLFPEALGDVDPQAIYRACNHVAPSFIRVEADEVTYNLHIMLRFELELALISGDLKPADLPAEWNSRFTKYFGITPANDADGCLQDVHWSAGLVGYFPTYALGNMYAAALHVAAGDQLGSLDDLCRKGKFIALKNWLNENVHRRGRQYPPAQLIETVTGQPLSPDPLLRFLKNKFEPLYGLS